ncbi:MAG: MFS transporter [Chloroflexia bacterium]
MSSPSSEPRPGRRNILALGLVSFLTDISSEMTLTLLPLFLADTLGVKTAIIGLIEGIAESTATLLKLVSGWVSDRLRRRKALAVLGYGLSSLSKPLLYFANAWLPVLGIRFADRVGKGLRTAPRDALVADSAEENAHGRAFGLHRALDTAGAVWGTGIAAIVIFLSQQGAQILNRATYQRLVLVGMVPGLLAVLLLLALVREVRPRVTTAQLPRLSLRGYERRFYVFLASVVLFTLGNSSDAFLLLRARNLGLSAVQVALMVFAFNALYSLLSMPLGALSDLIGRRRVILLGWGVYGLIYLGFARACAGWQVALLYIFYGLYYAAFEGTSRALVADVVPESARRGTAYGLYHFAVGVTAFPASLIAGLLWQTIAPPAPFYFGASLALAAVLLFALAVRPGKEG